MTRDQKALVENGIALVLRLASRLKCMLPKSVDKEDLIAVGNLGLVKAALKFDPKRGVPFAVYARVRIRGEMRDQFRRDSRISRRARENGELEPVLWSFESRLKPGRARLEEMLEDRRFGPAQIVASDDAAAVILQRFTGRDRRIFEMRYVDGFTCRMVSAILGISEARVCAIARQLRAMVRHYAPDAALNAAS